MSATSELLNRLGLGSLSAWAEQQLTIGLSESEMLIQLRDRPEYKQRFIGNELRRARGLPMLDETSYVREEENYRTLLRQYGLDPRRFDSADDFAALLGNDIRAEELGQRLGKWESVKQAGPRAKEALSRAIGVNASDEDLYDLATGQRPDLAQAYADATGTTLFTADISNARDTIRTQGDILKQGGITLAEAQKGLDSVAAQRAKAKREYDRAVEMRNQAKTESAKKIWQTRIDAARKRFVDLTSKHASLTAAHQGYTKGQADLTAAQQADAARVARFSDFAGTDETPLIDLERAASQVIQEEKGMYAGQGSVQRSRTLREATF